MIRFTYRLDSYEGEGNTRYVDALNKTQARKEIAQAYREDTPRSAARSGFIPWSKCTIVWLGESDASSGFNDYDYSDKAEDQSKDTNHPLDISDPRIGALMRGGNYVYYTYLGSDYTNGYTEGSLKQIQDRIANAGACC